MQKTDVTKSISCPASAELREGHARVGKSDRTGSPTRHCGPRPITGADLEWEVGLLADLPRRDLVVRWKMLYRTAPPKGISRALLIRGIAYAVQVKRYGGLKPAVRRRLRAWSNGDAAVGPGVMPNKAVMKASPGTRLVREWNGVSHMVEVVDGGFVWNGERHSSLSAVARAITGARWSGPRFFGLGAGDGS
jgi:hypothetical protein